MKKSMINKTRIEGLLYEHDLTLKVTGEKSKNPGTEFISGTVSVATDNACINIVPVHFTYTTAVTSTGKTNATFAVLKNIIDGTYGTIMKDGKDKAAMVAIDSAIGLNEFYTDRGGKEEFVSAKRNEGGFVRIVDAIAEDEKLRNTFACDIVINGTRRIEADPEKNLPEKMIVKGAIFDFRNALLPIEFSVTNENAMNYFESLEASDVNPTFTEVRGRQISETIVRQIVEESAFGEASVREVKNTRKDFVITWAKTEPYVWDDESSITATEMREAITNREVYLAGVKQRHDEYKASKGDAPAIATPAAGGFQF